MLPKSGGKGGTYHMSEGLSLTSPVAVATAAPVQVQFSGLACLASFSILGTGGGGGVVMKLDPTLYSSITVTTRAPSLTWFSGRTLEFSAQVFSIPGYEPRCPQLSDLPTEA